MRAALILLILAILMPGGYIVYRRATPPEFFIRSTDFTNKKGVFSFGGKEFPFALNQPSSHAAFTLGTDTKWRIKIYTQDNSVIFDLYKGIYFDNFIKTLHTVPFG